ncbi:MAG: hypothetical protein H5T97_01340 [Firmicutes bacterium]|nr:hypothetical protein [Bacillota bacterium]
MHRIEITAEIDPASVGDWYEIRTQLGYYQRLIASGARAMTFKIPYRRLSRGEEPDPNEVIPVTMDNLADATHLKLMVWLKAWSHPEPIQSSTVKRIPESHARAILDAIEECEVDQHGPERDGPLAGRSSG